MTIELDTTLAQAEVLFLSFSQLVADVDRRRAEEASSGGASVVQRRGAKKEVRVSMPVFSDDLRGLLRAGR